MARIERKVFYIGTWRDEYVTDSMMRQISEHALVEKGKKVKFRLSENGIHLSKTVVLQENCIAHYLLPDIYALTVSQRHPTCLLCVISDPVKKYCIVAIKCANEDDVEDITRIFNTLKDNPTISSGHEELQRKENGNWTLRERNTHIANRRLLEIFNDAPPSIEASHHNGDVDHYATIQTSARERNWSRQNSRTVSTSSDLPDGAVSATVSGVPRQSLEDLRNETDRLSEDLHNIRLIAENQDAGTRASSAHAMATAERSHIIDRDMERHVLTNGEVISAHRSGDTYLPSERPGEARVVVHDYRLSRNESGMARAHSNGGTVSSKPVVVTNGQVKRQITVPEPTQYEFQHSQPVIPQDGVVYAANTPDHKIYRRTSHESVQMPFDGYLKQATGTESMKGSIKVKFQPQSVRHGKGRQPLTLRSKSGFSTTVLKPIEEVYRHHRPTILHQQLIFAPPTSPSGSVRVIQRSRPSSVHIMEGSGHSVYEPSLEVNNTLYR